MANSFEYNGEDMADYGVTVLQPTPFPVGNEFQAERSSVPFIDGSFSGPSWATAKRIPLEILIEGDSFADLKDKIDTIARIIYTRSDKILRIDHIAGRYWTARINSVFDPDVYGANFAKAGLEFYSQDGPAYDNSETTEPFTIDSAPFDCVFSVGGTSITYGLITIVVGAGQTPASISVVNNSEEYATTLVITRSFSPAEQVRINCDPKQYYVELSDDGGSSWTDIMANTDGLWPVFEPGKSNTIEIGGLSVGTASIVYRKRYI